MRFFILALFVAAIAAVHIDAERLRANRRDLNDKHANAAVAVEKNDINKFDNRADRRFHETDKFNKVQGRNHRFAFDKSNSFSVDRTNVKRNGNGYRFPVNRRYENVRPSFNKGDKNAEIIKVGRAQ